jgi:hypothetical protein
MANKADTAGHNQLDKVATLVSFVGLNLVLGFGY